MITKKSLSIVIPFFNEEQELPLLFRDFIKFEKNNPNLIIEYLFINDGSKDDSLRIISNLKKKTKKKINSKIKIFSNTKNIGWAKTLIRGYKKSTGKYILFIPGDGEVKLTQFLKNIIFGEKEVIIVQRNSMMCRPIIRILISYIYRIVISLIFFIKIIDYNGLIILKKDIVKKLNISSNSFFISAEIIVKSFKLDLNIDYMNSFKLFPKNSYKSTSLSLNQLFKVAKDIFITLAFVRSIK
jgi:glycosyltransferase involved in cell wall biosynthesis